MITQNQLLSCLPESARQQLGDTVQRVVLPAELELHAAHQTLDAIHFIETGMASLVWRKGEHSIDAALVGYEGLIGHPLALGLATMPCAVVLRAPVIAWRLPASAVQSALEIPELRRAVLNYVGALITQIGEATFANGRLTVEQRLARWILIAGQRMRSRNMSFTHEYLASAVGCRRSGVTMALHLLEGEHAIKSTRNKLMVIDAEKLRSIAAERITQLKPVSQSCW